MNILRATFPLALLAVHGMAIAATPSTDGLAERVNASIREAFCPKPAAPAAGATAAAQPADAALEPARVFDDLYFVGDRSTSSWVLTTPEGYILFDAGFHGMVEGTIVGGMQKLGLDPAKIRYVIVSHGHNDHFGGAQFLQSKYGARIVLSAADWEHMRTWPQRGSPAPFPKDDVVVKDGDTVTLGGVTVRMVITPGHTPGTLSPLFTVHDRGQPHVVGYWGGDGAGYLDQPGLRQYMASAQRFATLEPKADVPLSNHVVADGTVEKLALLKARKAGEPNPFVTTNAQFRAWAGQLRSCAEAFLPTAKP